MPPYGGFWVRVLAYILDSIILNIAVSIVSFAIGLGLGARTQAGVGNPESMQLVSGLLGSGVSLVGSWLYFAIMESSSHQATVGKLALGLAVTDERGNRIGFGRATGRYFAKILSGLILLIGFMMVGWTQRKQGLHDMIAGTLVYKTRDPQNIGVDVDVFR
jgi:uncharacterized RDD family membrane protein YckC